MSEAIEQAIRIWIITKQPKEIDFIVQGSRSVYHSAFVLR
jgi:hypothetical protein